MVRQEGRSGSHWISVVLAAKPRGGKSVANLDPLGGVDRHHRRRKLRIELGVNRGTPTRGNSVGDTFDHGAERGPGLSRRFRLDKRRPGTSKFTTQRRESD